MGKCIGIPIYTLLLPNNKILDWSKLIAYVAEQNKGSPNDESVYLIG